MCSSDLLVYYILGLWNGIGANLKPFFYASPHLLLSTTIPGIWHLSPSYQDSKKPSQKHLSLSSNPGRKPAKEFGPGSPLATPGICYERQGVNITISSLLGLRLRCSSVPQFPWLLANLKNSSRLGHPQGHNGSGQWFLNYSMDQNHLGKMCGKCQFMGSTFKDSVLVDLECWPGLPFLFSFCCCLFVHRGCFKISQAILIL